MGKIKMKLTKQIQIRVSEAEYKAWKKLKGNRSQIIRELLKKK